jgi:hypothetical protein
MEWSWCKFLIWAPITILLAAIVIVLILFLPVNFNCYERSCFYFYNSPPNHYNVYVNDTLICIIELDFIPSNNTRCYLHCDTTNKFFCTKNMECSAEERNFIIIMVLITAISISLSLIIFLPTFKNCTFCSKRRVYDEL